MGSSEWIEFSAYVSDPLIALTRVHQDVFTNERYFDRMAAWAATQPHLRERYPKPPSIQALVSRVGRGRTHSALDITRLSQRWEEGAARLLSVAQIRRYLRSDQPTQTQVQRRRAHIMAIVPSECACYFIVYMEGHPFMWCFLGATGDG